MVHPVSITADPFVKLGFSPPRVRGNPDGHLHWGFSTGSIPACAGEPSPTLFVACTCAVYPRVCGGTDCRPERAGRWRGLSPRVRGNRLVILGSSHLLRSIPACAGEPLSPALLLGHRRVYPRVCGGTKSSVSWMYWGIGLSPRVRGTRARPGRPAPPAGSIPACAGDPRSWRWASTRCTVYPRVCGGPVSETWRGRARPGLSPRVRGTRR